MKKLLPPKKPLPLSPSPLTTIPAPLENVLINKTIKIAKNTVTIEEVIAEGGFGVVFLAKNQSGKFALKRIVVNGDEGREAAEREIAVMSLLTPLSSPFLLPLLSSSSTLLPSNITEYLTLTPYYRGNLLQLLNKSMATKVPLPEKQVLTIFSHIVQGVATMHSMNWIHRDLKIENVLENNGVWLLCDFGSATDKILDPQIDPVAKIQEELEKYTTLAYRSIEMVDLYSNRGPIWKKSDIWALGVALYKTLHLSTPYGDSLLAIQSGKKPDFPPSTYSPEINSIVTYCLIDQTHRPDIQQLSELIHNQLQLENPLVCETKPMTFQEIHDYHKKETATVKTVISNNSVVLETSVTPRQRPKPGVANELMPIPKSPRSERRSPVNWNPFEDAFESNNSNATDDVFANAPFGNFSGET